MHESRGLGDVYKRQAITMLFLLFVMFLTLIQRWLVERKVHY